MSNQINEGAARYNDNTSSHSREGGDPLPIIDHLDLWTSTVTPKSTSGRGSNSKIELTGIKKLREMILELAVRGKLVAQSPDDEPASKLLERIGAEKAQLVKDGKLKKQKPLAPVSEDEKPFELPEGWEWVRLGNLGNTQTGGTPAKGKAEYFTGNIPFVKPGDIDQGILKNSSEFLSESGLNALGREVPKGSLLMVCIGTIGKCAISRERCSFNQQINSITPFLPMEEYLLAALSSSYFQEMAWSNSSSTTISILNKGKWGNICIPLPPLSEQQRIVAKVDELMALCDQLEQQSEHQLTAHQQLTDTLLATLTESADAQELNDNWQRLANHFDLLFSGPMGAWAIDRLKDTILQLAVMGKLVPQNPEDEPASKLLERIEEEKARLVKEGKIKKPKKLPPVSDEEKPFKLPEGWEWVRFDNLIHPESVISYGVLVPGPDVDDGVPFVRIEDLSLNCPSDLPNKRISREVDSQYERTRLHGGEILMGVVGSIGKLGLAPSSWKGANIARAVCRIDPSSLISKEYIITILQSQFMQNSFAGDTRTLAQPTLNIGLIRTTVTPLPPLAEQQGIVAKVDELFALCDQLKERLQHASETQLNITDAIIEKALNS